VAHGAQHLVRLLLAAPDARRIGTLFVPAEVNSVYNKEKLLANGDRWETEIAASLAADAPYR